MGGAGEGGGGRRGGGGGGSCEGQWHLPNVSSFRESAKSSFDCWKAISGNRCCSSVITLGHACFLMRLYSCSKAKQLLPRLQEQGGRGGAGG
jgi:hypothetical protein